MDNIKKEIHNYIDEYKKSISGNIESVKFCIENSQIQELLPYYTAITKDPKTMCFLNGYLRWQTNKEDIIKVLDENKDLVDRYKNGDIKLLNTIIGKVINKYKGVFPEDIKELLDN
jgi:Asp-tRNA(Asn)/Glu-tRNA(Gln) amidotransferase B subunit